jgi:MFS family permease
VLVGTGLTRAAGFTYPFLAYRLSGLGFSTRGVSGVLALFGVGWLVGQILWGRAADVLGRRTALVSAMSLAAVTFPLLAQATGPIAVGGAAVVAGAVYDASRPVVTAVVSDQVADAATRARITGWRHFATNIGAAVTGAVGGLLADTTGVSLLFWINGLACGIFALAVLRVMDADRPRHEEGGSGRGTYRQAAGDVRLWLLWLVSLAALVPAVGLFSIMPLLMEARGLSVTAYGWTQVASAAAVLIVSAPLNAWLGRRASQSTMVGLLGASALVLGAGIGSAGLADSTLEYAAAAVCAVPGEVTVFVAANAVLDRIAPAHSRGLYAGIWGSTLAAAVICAPALAGWSLAHGGPGLVGLTTLSCGVLGAVVCLPLGLLLRRARTPRQAPRPDLR